MSGPVDTSRIFKQPVHCVTCDEAFYFTLSSIAENQRLACPLCSADINLGDDAYRPLVATVKETIVAIRALGEG
jgi:hypothetical protein